MSVKHLFNLTSEPQLQFDYADLEGDVSLFNVEGQNLQLVGDFGQLNFQGSQAFAATKMTLLSPSEHTFGKEDKHFPLEVQIYH